MRQKQGSSICTYKVSDLANHTDSLQKLAVINPDWKLSPEEVLDCGKNDQKIFKLKFTNHPVKLQPNELADHSISVIVAGHQIGCIRSEDVPQVRAIMDEYDIRSITCGIWGGQYKIIDEECNVDIQKQGISASIRIAYDDLGLTIDDSFEFDEDTVKSAEAPKKHNKSKKKKAKKPFYKRWWFWLIIVIFLFGSYGDSDSQSTMPTPSATTSDTTESISLVESTPLATTEENTVSVITTAETIPQDNISLGEKNALRSAQSYLSFTAFSYNGLIEQLKFEGYTTDEATYAADNCGVNWYDQALASAKNYLGFTAFSYSGLIDQLEFEGFTTDEATYGVDNCGADWYEQAAKSAENYLTFTSFSRSGLIDQLEFEGFTHEQAVYGAEQNGY